MTPTKRVPASHGPLEIQDQQDLPDNHIKTDRSNAPFVSRAANVQLQLRTNLPLFGKFSMEILMSNVDGFSSPESYWGLCGFMELLCFYCSHEIVSLQITIFISDMKGFLQSGQVTQ
jgi:hypothetical protein